MPDIKLVVFDLNKTLIHENTWHDLNMALGVTQEEDDRFMQWYETGKITYEEGQKMIEELYHKSGKATRDFMLSSISHYSYMPGAKEIITYLINKGYEVALITGSIDILAERVSEELGIALYAAHNHLVFDDADNFVRIQCEGFDYEFKVNEVHSMCEKLGIEHAQVVFVGDGDNDTEVFKLSGHGVTFRGSRVEDRAWKVIDTLEDIKTIL